MAALRLLTCPVLALALLGPADAQQLRDDSLAAQLHALSQEHAFQVQGIDKLVDSPARRASGNLNTRIRILLDGYNHVIEGTATGVGRVIIIGPKTLAAAGFSQKTMRRGAHHAVDTTLLGNPGHRTRVELMVDTGASTLVLPASMMASLGYRDEDLPDSEVQTVNGRMTGKLAKLERVAVGNASATGIAALFVDDGLLGGAGLLGMSFLEHFDMTIRDADDRLVLTPR